MTDLRKRKAVSYWKVETKVKRISFLKYVSKEAASHSIIVIFVLDSMFRVPMVVYCAGMQERS